MPNKKIGKDNSRVGKPEKKAPSNLRQFTLGGLPKSAPPKAEASRKPPGANASKNSLSSKKR